MTDPNLLPEPYHGASDPVLLVIGDTSITRTSVIVPTGQFPLRGTAWTIQDSTQSTESISPVGLILAIVSVVLAVVLVVFTCGLSLLLLAGLLFLLMKDRKVTGFITVNVVGNGLFHSVQLQPGPQMLAWANQQVNQARTLAAAA